MHMCLIGRSRTSASALAIITLRYLRIQRVHPELGSDTYSRQGRALVASRPGCQQGSRTARVGIPEFGEVFVDVSSIDIKCCHC